MHTLNNKPSLSLALFTAKSLLDKASVPVLEQSYKKVYKHLFQKSPGSCNVNSADDFEISYIFSYINNDSYFNDVFYGNYFLDYSPKKIISFMDEVLLDMEPQEAPCLTQGGFFRLYSETHPSKSFGECEEYHAKNLVDIFTRYKQAKTMLNLQRKGIKDYLADSSETEIVNKTLFSLEASLLPEGLLLDEQPEEEPFELCHFDCLDGEEGFVECFKIHCDSAAKHLNDDSALLLKDTHNGYYNSAWDALSVIYAKHGCRVYNSENFFEVYLPEVVTEQKFEYQLLSRLQMDNDSFLNHPHEKRLWAGNVAGQIAEMKRLYNVLKVKPEWITMQNIEDYEQKMTVVINEQSA